MEKTRKTSVKIITNYTLRDSQKVSI